MLKNIKKILLSFLLILPLCFAFVGCGENPETPPEPSVPGGENNPPVVQTYFYVSADYALERELAGLLDNPAEVKVSTSSTYTLPSFSGVLADYFDGWYTRPGDTKIEGETLSGTSDDHIQIYAKWKPELYEFYYSDGVTFVTDSSTGFATVSGYNGSESKVILPKSFMKDGEKFAVTKIGDDAFSDKNISSVVLLSTEVEVGNNAFKNTKLESFEFERVKSIGESAFSGTKIQSVTVSNKLQSLSRYAFAGCENLTSVDLTQSSATLTTIPFNCFNGCTKLSEVKLSLYITTLGSQAFSGCSNLQDISFVNQSIKMLGANVFEGCDKVQEFNFSSNIDECAENALDGLSVTKITLSKIIQSKSGNIRFNSILGTASDSVQEIDIACTENSEIPNSYFANLQKLTTIKMSDFVESIGENAFMGCTSLINFELPQNLNPKNLKASAFYDTAWYNNSSEFLISGGVLLLAPKNIPSEITAEQLSGVTSMTDSIFEGTNTITKITFPSTLQSISVKAFCRCTSLTAIDFEEGCGVTIIDEFAFNNCTRLTEVNLDKCTKLATIGNSAFANIGSIAKLSLPSSIQTLGQNVFFNSPIGEFEINGNSKYVVEDGVLYEGADKTKLYAYPTMKNATYFKIPSSVKEVCSGAFNYYGTRLKYLIICSQNITISSQDICSTTTVYSKYELPGLQKAKVMLASENYTFDEADRSMTLTEKYVPTDDATTISTFIAVESGDGYKMYLVEITGTNAKIIREFKDFPASVFFE